jgi:hypothetical protein
VISVTKSRCARSRHTRTRLNAKRESLARRNRSNPDTRRERPPQPHAHTTKFGRVSLLFRREMNFRRCGLPDRGSSPHTHAEEYIYHVQQYASKHSMISARPHAPCSLPYAGTRRMHLNLARFACPGQQQPSPSQSQMSALAWAYPCKITRAVYIYQNTPHEPPREQMHKSRSQHAPHVPDRAPVRGQGGHSP